ncbi:MAG: DUF4831 family protein [Bacteroidales bacterium]
MRTSFILTLFFLFLLVPSCKEQKVLTSFDVKKAPSGLAAEGFHYFLPKTVIAVDVTVTRTENQPGPFAQYAERFLGLENIIGHPSVNYSISRILINGFAEPDPDQMYFVQFDQEDEALQLTLSEAGMLLSVNKSIDDPALKKHAGESKEYGYFGTEATFNYFIDLNLEERIDTITERVRVDTMTVERQTLRRRWVEKSSESRAREVADHILSLRDKKFDLITGFAEIPYSRESLEYMYREMDRKENDYLALFTGISSSESIRYRYTYTPDRETDQTPRILFYFSERDGVLKDNLPGSTPVSIQTMTDQTTSPLLPLVQRTPASRSGQTGFYYRIPEHATVILKEGEVLRAEARMLINQFGVVTWLPPAEMEIEFYPNTGSVKSVGRLRDH